MSLYDALNVAKNATLAEIKKAYRSLAKTHHPDAGGDPARFNEIALAYDVLKDDEKRARYDDTGKLPDPESNPNARAIAIVGELVDALTNDIVMRDDLQHDDLIAKMVKKVDGMIADMTTNRKEAEAFEKKATKIRKRFKAKKGPDYIGTMIDGKVDACRKAITQAIDQLGHLEKARKILLDAEFEIEPRPKQTDMERAASVLRRAEQDMYTQAFWPRERFFNPKGS